MAKNVMSPEGRAKIVAAQKARWAKKKAAKEAVAPPTAAPVVEPVEPDEPMTVIGQAFPMTECTNCEFKAENLTFAQAIEAHNATTRCKSPCLINPSKKFMKARLLKELTNSRGR